MQTHFVPMLRYRLLFLAFLPLLTLSGCLARQEVLAKKSLGHTYIYPLSVDQTYIAALAALRWSSDAVIEDHREEGYVLSRSATITRYGKVGYSIQHYSVIWLDAIDSNQTSTTIVTSDMVFGREKC